MHWNSVSDHLSWQMTGDEVGGAGESSGEVATFPGRGYARHDRTLPYCTCYAALLGYTTAKLYQSMTGRAEAM